MKIDSVSIENFRGIQKLEATSLGDTIIIAGQNGSGKSCLFDAIRLLKSTYGGYQQNEWQQFFGEFAIQLHGGSKNLKGLFNDSSKPAVIECIFKLRDAEKSYITNNAEALLEEAIWQMLLPEAFQWGGYQKALFAHQFRERQPEVSSRVQAELPSLRIELASEKIIGKIIINPNGHIQISDSRLLTVIFTNYKPREIGVIDFHGAQRHYGRENVQGINLSLDQANQQYSQHTLYNYNNKYANVKSEMAGNFVKELLAEKSVGSIDSTNGSLSETLKELFESFFPEKKFLGPQPTPDGSLSFPVITPNGTEHDLDELSSGEKEILYGYLRIRSSAPRDSIILLDEPELHLNPRLIRGLPEFYRKHLGEALQNQLWLVTHSDALIREAVGKPGFNVFHMIPCGSQNPETSQLRPLTVSADLEIVVADLVGDLAAYRPGGKAIIFEGGGDSDFDKTIVASLFRNELRGINLLSGTNKTRVNALHEILERAYKNGDLPTKFYALTDKDSDERPGGADAITRMSWDVYHIENYLLDSKIISETVNSLTLNDELTPAEEELSEQALKELEQKMRADFEECFADGTWRTNLPGREILKRFVEATKLPVRYEVFRNLLRP
ncbi:AAA family ATPase [Methylomonas sp. MO1]|uniref:AAA family ATPase n=1 Tax=Methylomonas sp. MO1 TaxID=3073619 RepID=UPI0028A3EF11|nr:AAA family ATPase [Methylomonas sp. MO1]MDT4291889.1 AAA family ATPase [Methylomonas sp. MO1]